MTEKLCVVVLDERRLLRDSLVQFLKNAGDDIDVREAANLPSALGQIDDPQSGAIVLVNSRSNEDDLGLVIELKQSAPGTRVVLIAARAKPSFVARAIHAGASGVLFSSLGGREAYHVLRLVSSGGMYAPVEALLSAFPAGGAPAQLAPEPDATDLFRVFPELSRKQASVLNLVAKGRSNQEIAAEIHMRENAVKAHVHQIMRKLGVRNRTEAALLTNQRLFGMRNGEG